MHLDDVGTFRRSAHAGVERDALAGCASFGCPAAAGVVDQDVAHYSGEDTEEILSAFPLRRHAGGHPYVRLVEEGGGLEGQLALFLAEEGGGHAVELVIDQGEHLLMRGGIAGAPGVEELRQAVFH